MNSNILNILKTRCFIENESSWNQLSRRVAKIYPPIEKYIKNMSFIPSSPTLMNAGTKMGTLSSCFPMGITDSIVGIFDSIKECAIVTKYSGGVGYDFSSLRGSNETVKGIGNKVSSGPISFMRVFNESLDSVRQGGRRRGAAMGLLSIYHPDILNFIRCKEDVSNLNMFNISVKIDKKFYESLEKTPDKQHNVTLVTTGESIPLESDGKFYTVKDIWDTIIEKSWLTGEPGIFNVDIAKERCSTINYSDEVIINPCSEFTNHPYTSCMLGSINLNKMFKNNSIDWTKIKLLINDIILFMDNIFKINNYPIDKIKKTTLDVKPIGIGIMGLDDLFKKMGYYYGSPESIQLTKNLMKYITLLCMRKSVDMVINKEAEVYNAFDTDTFLSANKRFFEEPTCREISIDLLVSDIKKYGIAHSSFTSIAPTGSISTIAECSGGIEPHYANVYNRRLEDNTSFPVYNNTLLEYLNKKKNEKDKQKVLDYIIKHNGSCQGCGVLLEKEQMLFRTANEIPMDQHLSIVEAANRYTSLSVSKTINCPESTGKDEISKAFLSSYKRNLIGVTVYRDNSRNNILSTNSKRFSPKRPTVLSCNVERVTVNGEKWIIFVSFYNDTLYEVFAGKVCGIDIPNIIKKGQIERKKKGHYSFIYENQILVENISDSFNNDTYEAITRLLSTSLRHGIPIRFLVQQLGRAKGVIYDFAKVLKRVLSKYLENQEIEDVCPDCNSRLIRIEGCVRCANECGFSQCS